MEQNELYNRITHLADLHKATGDELEDIKDSDSIEMEAWDVIYQYCLYKNYMTPVKFLETKPVFEEDDTFGEKKWFIDTLIISHADVAEVSYHLVNQFWPEEFSSKEDFIEATEAYLEASLY